MTYSDEVTNEVNRIRARKEARRIVAAAEAEELVLPTQNLTELLALDFEPPEWRIENLHQLGMNTTLAAQYKTGKTTMSINLIRSLADGTPFLRKFKVKPVEGTIAYWNLEVGTRQMQDWLRRLNIANTDKVIPVNLRGQHVGLYQDATRDHVVEWMKRQGVVAWIVDPMGRLLPGWPNAGNGRENSNDVMREVGMTLDVIKYQADIEDLWVITHTGRAGDHTRGATVNDDWPDALWHMTKRKVIEGERMTRFFWAEGREAELEEVALGFNKDSLETWVEADLMSIKLDGHAKSVVMAIIRAGHPLKAAELRKALQFNTSDHQEAIEEAIERGWITRTGEGNTKIHTINTKHPDVQLMLTNTWEKR